MDKLSLFSIIFVSVPEELLIIITTLVITGNVNALNFERIRNIVKLFLSAILGVILTTIFRDTLHSITLNAIITFTTTYLILIAVYKFKPLNCILGFFISIFVLIVSESLTFGIGLKYSNTALEYFYENDFNRLLISFPVRIMQLFPIAIICKCNNIHFKFIKLSIREWLEFVFYLIIIINSMFYIESVVINIKNSLFQNIKLILNIFITIFVCSLMIYKMFMLKKIIRVKEKTHKFELQKIKKMILENSLCDVIKLIDMKNIQKENEQ